MVKKIVLAAIFTITTGMAVLADAPPSHYDITPLTKADLDLYLSVMRPASDYVAHAKGEDRAAIEYMKETHGNPKMPEPPKVPHFNHPPTQAEMAAMQKAMDNYQNEIKKPQEYMTRATTLSSYDDEIAKQHHVEKQYDAVKDPIENALTSITGQGGSCGGDDCGPTHPTADQKALWKKEEDVAKANVAFVRPHASEIEKLKKPLHDIMFTQ